MFNLVGLLYSCWFVHSSYVQVAIVMSDKILREVFTLMVKLDCRAFLIWWVNFLEGCRKGMRR